jgi:hypothetical protein
MADTTALKLNLLLGSQTAHGTILDGDHIAASAWNTGSSFRYGLVLVRATEEKSGIGPSCGVVDGSHPYCLNPLNWCSLSLI